MPDDAGTFERHPPVTPEGRRRLTLGDLHRMIDAGILAEGERTELVEGELRVMPSEGELHDAVLDRLTDLLAEALGPRFRVRQRGPFNIQPAGQLAPDVSVWPADVTADRKTGAHVRLLCEVSRTTQAYDLGEKALLYAKSGALEYWVIEPEARRLTVFREATSDGWLHRDVAVAPTARPLCASHVDLAWTQVFDG